MGKQEADNRGAEDEEKTAVVQGRKVYWAGKAAAALRYRGRDRGVGDGER